MNVSLTIVEYPVARTKLDNAHMVTLVSFETEA